MLSMGGRCPLHLKRTAEENLSPLKAITMLRISVTRLNLDTANKGISALEKKEGTGQFIPQRMKKWKTVKAKDRNGGWSVHVMRKLCKNR